MSRATLPTQQATPDDLSAPPIATRDETRVIEQHGQKRLDPYAWLRADNWRDVMRDPSVLPQDIRAYLEAENAFTKARLEDPTAILQADLFEEMKGRIKDDDSTVPQIDGPWAYYRRFREGGEYPVYARKPTVLAFEPGSEGEQLLLDAEAMGKGHDYFDLRTVSHSPDHQLLAYAFDDKGSEFYTIRIRDLETNEDLAEEIAGAYGDFVWGADSRTLYWVERDENARPVAVRRRRIGVPGDDLVYAEPDPGFFVGVHKTSSRAFIVITANDHTTSESHVFPADAAEPEPRLIAARETGVEYSLVHFDDRFWISTNRNNALDFKIVSAPVDAPSADNWQDEIPHRPGVLILDLDATHEHFTRLEREDGAERIVIRNRSDGAEHAIDFTSPAYSLALHASHEWRTFTLRFNYSAPDTPAQVYDYDMAARTRILRKQQEVPSGHNPDDYVVERIDAHAPDGETVPVTLLRHKSTPVDGKAPVLLYGYGAYGLNIPDDFRTARLSLVDRGFIYALAHIRGSTAKGYGWYLDGKLEKKTNTFTDFIAAAHRLIDAGYTTRGNIVAMGGSAGGMLMGAVVNAEPELFAGIIAAVPFVDVLNTMSDDTLPLTPPEWPEWGNPIEDAEAYGRIADYSPYDQTREKPYPPMLITGGLTDPRVTYWEPAKWAARLRHEAPHAGPYYLKINMDAGHGGMSGRFASLRETALDFTFALAAVGKAPEFSLKR